MKLRYGTNKLITGNLRVCVLAGGIGAERNISIESGSCVAEALSQAGLDVITADIGPDNLDILDDTSIDVFFIALHGEFGEDGQLQQILEDKSLIYTGSGPDASRLAFDKLAAKKCFTESGVTTPRVIDFDLESDATKITRQLSEFGNKFVIKPVKQGSTIGVSIVDDVKSALQAGRRCISEFGDCMIEEFISGREITVGILDNHALPVIEIRSKTGFYDYHAKYVDDRTEFLFDTIDSSKINRIQSDALCCYNSLGLKHFARIDMILDDEQRPYVLEANTIPGLTTHSLLPKAAAKAGISMSDLCIKIVEAAHSSLAKRKA